MTEKSLLDIGSAAGFFLKCARDYGFKRVLGLEVSAYASAYCEEEFGIPVLHSSFDDAEVHDAFDVISAWFFIEHSADPVRTIRRIHSLLKNGGVFAASMPSAYGPMFMMNRQEWIRTHPEDHRVDITPASIKRFLRGLGFKKIKVIPAGFHPERIVSKESFFHGIFSLFYRLFSRVRAFSDTVEVYALKG